MEMTFDSLNLPCKLVLVDYQSFLQQSKEKGELSYALARLIADRGFVMGYSLVNDINGVPMLNTGLKHGSQYVGILEHELKYFKAHKADF